MPKEQKISRKQKAGEILKRKRNLDSADVDENPRKRRASNENDWDNDYIKIDEEKDFNTLPFYGLLGDEEQEYFRRSDELLELNDFPDEETRSFFLANVFREAENKELKIACSQSCSRLMERLILLCSTDQKKTLFQKFSGNFVHLIRHRFASHCCEMLFIQSAPIVTEELTSKSSTGKSSKSDFPTMENLFLQTLDEIEGCMSSLLTDVFASHTLRVLLMILDGRTLGQHTSKTLVQSKRKEKIEIMALETKQNENLLEKRQVPPSFTFAVEKIISDIASSLDPPFIRLLATHPTGNPTLQLLLELELTSPNLKEMSKLGQNSIISSILPDAIDVENSNSVSLINGLLYDSIGSRLLETICMFASGKLFKKIYQIVFKDRIAAILRNEISSYTAIRVLSRIGKQDLEEALQLIIPQIPKLVERNRSLAIRTLIERCHARCIDTSALTSSISEAYGGHRETLILKMTCLDTTTLLSMTSLQHEGETEIEKDNKQKPSHSQLQGSLLAQSMLMLQGPSSELIQDALISLPPQILLSLSLYTTTSHLIQSALSPTLPVLFRRKLINLLLFSLHCPSSDRQIPILRLCLSSVGSHVLDALLTCTIHPSTLSPHSDSKNSTNSATPLFSYAERISSVLVAHEHEIRNSFYGRIIWRNWSIDLFKRMRSDWVRKVKNFYLTTIPIPSRSQSMNSSTKTTMIMNNNETEVSCKTSNHPSIKIDAEIKKDKSTIRPPRRPESNGKSAIELARERFASKKLMSSSVKKIIT
ncbi:putative rrna processing protein [Erysiphe necator]|uniref:Nucleolar protein 9 n=1 Tax=Uncinula necator TaxID=52586 RepID=A0A0B1PDC3_UNCNE|nr:putative rrna processing protein [Erysiphe necator]